ncbi:MAG: hypothetical protein HWQ40_04385 [Nostoc sp. NMS9]|nr:hypothetical protein [Nostoc sp. NMS9]
MGHWAWGIGHGALVLSVPLRGSKLRVASVGDTLRERREAEVLGIAFSSCLPPLLITNYVSAAVASPRSLLASRRERHYVACFSPLASITNYSVPLKVNS